MLRNFPRNFLSLYLVGPKESRKIPAKSPAKFPYQKSKKVHRRASASGGPKGGHLKGGHLKMGFRSEVRNCRWDFALQFALDTSILTALSKGIPQGRVRLDREGAV